MRNYIYGIILFVGCLIACQTKHQQALLQEPTVKEMNYKFPELESLVSDSDIVFKESETGYLYFIENKGVPIDSIEEFKLTFHLKISDTTSQALFDSKAMEEPMVGYPNEFMNVVKEILTFSKKEGYTLAWVPYQLFKPSIKIGKHFPTEPLKVEVELLAVE